MHSRNESSMHYANCKKPYGKGYTQYDFIYTGLLNKYKWNNVSTYRWMCFNTQYCSTKPFGCLNSWKWNHMQKTQYSDFQLGGPLALLSNLELLKGRPYLTFRKTQNYKKRGRGNRAVVSKSWKCGRQLTTKGRRELWGSGWSGPKFLL